MPDSADCNANTLANDFYVELHRFFRSIRPVCVESSGFSSESLREPIHSVDWRDQFQHVFSAFRRDQLANTYWINGVAKARGSFKRLVLSERGGGERGDFSFHVCAGRVARDRAGQAHHQEI